MNREAMMQGIRRNRMALAVCFGAVLLALTAACDPDSPPAGRDIAIEKLAVVSADGQTITYTITVIGSNGNSPEFGYSSTPDPSIFTIQCPLTVTDTLPPNATFVSSSSGSGWGGWTRTGSSYASAACGGSLFYDGVISVPSTPLVPLIIVASVPPGETVTNCASVSNGDNTGIWAESNMANNTSCVTTTMPLATAGRDIAIEKLAVVSADGQTITYTINVTGSNGDLPGAMGSMYLTLFCPFTITDVLPPGATFISSSSTNGLLIRTGSNYTGTWCSGLSQGWEVFDIIGVQSVQPDLPISLTIVASVPPGETVTNCASVSDGNKPGSWTGNWAESNLANNTSCVTTTMPAGDTGVTYVYSAKYVCGIVRPLDPKVPSVLGPAPVVPGVYRTAVNVHNFTEGTVTIIKKAVIALPEDEPRGAISKRVEDRLRDDEALEVDCQDVVKLLANVDARVDLQTGFVTGFVEIQSPIELQITTIYTLVGLEQGVSIDVESVQPHLIKK